MTVLYIGNHTSSSKGYAAMARQIIKNGGNTFAFFTRNPRGGKAKAIDETAEDIHMFMESELTKRIQDAGKRLHTARSRNDQVALDIRMYLRDETKCVRCKRRTSNFCA